MSASSVYTIDPSGKEWRAIFSATSLSGLTMNAPLRLKVRGKDLSGNDLFRTVEDRSILDRSALAANIPANGGADEVHRLRAPYYVSVLPPLQSVETDQRADYSLPVTNRWLPASADFIVTAALHADSGWESDIPALNNRMFQLPPGENRALAFYFENRSALDSAQADFKVSARGTGAQSWVTDISAGIGEAAAAGTCTKPPNRDHPDDNYSVASPNYPTPWQVDTLSEVGILLRGWGAGVGHLLGRYGIKAAPVGEDFAVLGEHSRKLEDLKVLVIGSAGLEGMRSQVWRERLKSFVANGGTLVAFTQPTGEDFAALPGASATGAAAVEGYGWNEDQSCFANSVYTADASPVFAGQTNSNLDVNMDGYFTKYPSETKVLLRRTATSMPALIEYPYGAGRVIAGAMFSDFGYGVGQSAQDEQKLVRDIVSYAAAPKPMQEYPVGADVSAAIAVRYDAAAANGFCGDNANGTSETDPFCAPMRAVKAVVTVYDPAGSIAKTQEAIVSLQPGESANIPLSLSASQAGVYRTEYAILDADGMAVQPSHSAASFAAKSPIEVNGYAPGTLQLWATTPGDNFPKGSVVSVTLHVRNNSAADFTGNLWQTDEGNISHDYRTILIASTVTIPAGQSVDVPYPYTPHSSGAGMFRLFFSLSRMGEDARSGSVSFADRAFMLFQAVAASTARFDQEVYLWGSTANLHIALDNVTGASFEGILSVDSLSPAGTSSRVSESPVSINPHSSIARDISFAVSTGTARGRWLAIVHVRSAQGTVDNVATSAGFDVASALLSLTPSLPKHLRVGTDALALTLTAKGEASVSSGTLSVRWLAPDGSINWTDTRPIGEIAAHGSASFDFSPAGFQIQEGVHTLEFAANYDGRSTTLKLPVRAQATAEFLFDRPAYRVRESMGMTLKVTNTGDLALGNVPVSVNIPDAGFDWSGELDLSPGAASVPLSAVLLPELEPGLPAVEVSMPFMDEPEKDFIFVVLTPELDAAILTPQVAAGETARVKLKNVGGVDARFTGSLTLTDAQGIQVSEHSIETGVIIAGTGEEEIDFNLPYELAAGNYTLMFDGWDSVEGASQQKWLKLSVTAEAPVVSVGSDKESYRPGETILATGTARTSEDVMTLELKAYGAAPGWKGYSAAGVINDIYDDGENVWFATADGVKRYEKASDTWRVYRSSETGGALANTDVVAISTAGSELWFLHRSHELPGVQARAGLAVFDKSAGSWSAIAVPEGAIPMTLAASTGYVWVAGLHGDLHRYEKAAGTWTLVREAEEGSTTAKPLLADEGGVWMGLRGPNNVEHYPNLANEPDRSIEPGGNALAGVLAQSGTELFIGVDDIVVRYDKSSGARLSEIEQPFGSMVSMRALHWDGTFLWIGADGGVAAWDKATEAVSAYTENEGLLSNDVRAVGGNGGVLWFGHGIGLTRFEPASAWENFPDAGIGGSAVFSVAAGEDAVAAGHERHGGYGLSALDKRTGAWKQGLSAGDVGSVQVLSGNVWYATDLDGAGLLCGNGTDCPYLEPGPPMGPRLDPPEGSSMRAMSVMSAVGGDSYKASGALADGAYVWYINPGKSDEYSYYPPSLWLYDPESGEWRGHGQIPDSENEWEPWPFWSNAPAVRMADDGDGLWAAARQTRTGWADPGIGRLDKSKGTWTTYGIQDGLPSADVNDVAVDGNVVWAATDRGAARWERATGHWSVFASTLPGLRVNAVLPAEDAVWFGTEKGLSRWSRLNGHWTHYTPADGLANEKVLSLATDENYLWVGTAGGLCRLTLRAGQDAVWSKVMPLPGETLFEFSEPVTGASLFGKYRLEGVVKNPFGQKLSQANNVFYVTPGNILLSFNAEKKSYKPGENIRILGTLRNMGALAEGGTLSLEKDGVALLSESVTLAPGESRPFSVETEAEESFQLKGKFQSLEVRDLVEVATPKVSLRLLGPDSVGIKPFSVTALIANDGDSFAELSLDFADSVSTFSLAAGESMILQGDFSVTSSTDIAAVLGGDVSRIVKKPVRMIASGRLSVEPDFTYPEGAVTVAYSLENDGDIPWELELRFFIDGTTITRRHAVQPCDTLRVPLVLENMAEGEHILRYESALFSGTALISVNKYGALRIDEFAVDAQSLTPEGKVHASGRVSNPGKYAFEGELRIESPMWDQSEQISLAPGAEKALSWDLPAGAVAGDYAAALQVYCGGNFVSEKKAAFRLEPRFTVESSSAAAAYPAGETRPLSFTIRNSGSAEGTAKLLVSAGEILGLEQGSWLGIGESKQFSFDVALPEDLESKSYAGTLSLSSPQTSRVVVEPFVLNVEGFALEASATFDKPVYDAGEVAHLSVSARSVNARTPAIFMKVNGASYESISSTFTAGPSVETRSFDIPVLSSGGPSYLIAWGVHLSSGRAVKLDTLYLNKRMDGLSVVLDKPRYGMGESVSASVTVESTGTLVLSAPGWTETIPVESTGTLVREFPLPGEMLSGTAYIHASLDGHGADWPLDVDGYKVRLVSMKLDKALYAADEDFNVELKIDSNRAASGVLLSGNVRGQEEDSPSYFESRIDIPQGLSVWNMHGKLPAGLSGSATLDARFEKEFSSGRTTLAAGSASFDIRKAGELAPHITLRLSSPAQGAMVKPPVPFLLEGTGLDGLQRVEFLLDGSTVPIAALAGGATSYAWTWEAAGASQDAHTVQAAGYDSGGRGLSNSVGFMLDSVPPQTSLLVNGLETQATALVLVPADILSLVSTDTLSGVAEIAYSLDSGPEQVYSSTFTLPAGTLQLAFHAKDHAGNVEPQRIVSVALASLDTTPPQTSLLLNGLAVSATSLVLTSTDSLGFSAVDAESGVRETRYSVDGTTEAVFVSTFSLSAGQYTLAFHSIDQAGNIELSRNAAIDVLLYDVTAPALALSPVSNSTIAITLPVLLASYNDAGRGIDAASVRLWLDDVDVTSMSLVNLSSATFIPAVGLAQGAHMFAAEVADLPGNRANASSSFFLDSLPPLTALLVNGAAVSSNNAVIVSTDILAFVAVDAGVGVQETRYSLDGSSNEVVFTSTFSLPSGDHSLAFRSLDLVGNAEPAKGILLTILSYDVTPPALALLPVNGSTIAATIPLLSAAYSDADRGMDLASVRLLLDEVDVTNATTISASSAAFIPAAALAQGAHMFAAEVADLAGNRAAASSRFFIDSLPPLTTLLVNGIPVSSNSAVIVSTDILAFVAVDTGVGVQETRYSLDSSTDEVIFASTFSLAAGMHTLAFHSNDHAGNMEPSRSTTLNVLLYDVDAPSLALSPVNGSTITLSAPLITAAYSDAGRGIDPGSVRLLLDAVDVTAQSVVSASSASFIPAMPLSQGTHAVSAEVADLAGNRATASLRFFIDSLSPLTTLLVNGAAVSSSSAVIVSTDALGFAASDAGVGVGEIRYSLDGSTVEIVFTSTFSLTAGVHALAFHSADRAGNVESIHTVSLTIQSYDVTPPALSLLPVNGSTITVTRPAMVAAYSDSGRGMDLASVRLSVDGVDVTAQAFVWASSAVYVPATALSQGTHTATAFAADLAGNGTSISTEFLLDSLPPITTLLVDALPSSATTLTLVSTDTLGFTASDSGVGVQETRYRLDGAAETVFSTAFSLAAGTHTLAFYSLDRAGNTEGQRAIGITVLSPPTPSGLLVRLDYPWPGALEVEQAVGGKVDVRGAIQGAGLRTWKLSVAPGVAANTGFTTLASGTAPVTGRIATWDATRLSGRFTLKLEATDSIGSVSLSTAAVYVGNPEAVFTVGSRGSDEFISLLKDPEGLVVRPDGKIWVGVDGTDKLLLISPEGELLASVGSHGRGPLKFQNPRGMSLDAGGNLYVADRGNDRVAKLSPDGSQLLKEFDADLQGPNDAVVDADGSVYVADTGHGRVRVFSPVGTVLRDISLGRHSRPWGVALTSAGLWVSDRQDRTVRLYSRG
ncbi:MAG: Ig-like domain-containing protein, partial [Elusimicrobiota bacterium]